VSEPGALLTEMATVFRTTPVMRSKERRWLGSSR
jgi:hypothetical protein